MPNLALMYHRNVRLIDIFLSRLLLEAAGATMSFVILSIIFIWLGWIIIPENMLLVIAGWIMLAWFGAALAVLLAAFSEEYEIVEKLWHPASYLLFPLSGAAFLVDALPANAQTLVLYLPMVHATECIREGFFGSQINARFDLLYMAECNLVMSLLGLVQNKRISLKVIPE